MSRQVKERPVAQPQPRIVRRRKAARKRSGAAREQLDVANALRLIEKMKEQREEAEADPDY